MPAFAKAAATALLAPLASGVFADQLVLFHQPNASPLAERFAQETLGQIDALAAELGLEMITVDVSEQGAPPGVDLTPLLVFQNHRGRSIFQGRYAELPRLRTFLTTARLVPQGDAILAKEQLPVRTIGGVLVGSPLKITGLTGPGTPKDFDQEALRARAHFAIPAGLQQTSWRETASFGRTDRLFYWDFYPYAAADGTLYLSLAIFSQFNCHDAVYTAYDGEVTGTLEEAELAFAEAAALLEAETERLIATSTLGDGFDAVGPTVARTSWEALGLELPPAPEGAAAVADLDRPIPAHWRIAPDLDSYGQFRFPAPLDNYIGQIPEMTGSLDFAPDLDPRTATGEATVPARSVTMGNPALDDTVYESISAEAHPESRFVLERVISANGDALAWGQPVQLEAEGRFDLKGMQVPLNVRAELLPGLDEAGNPILSATASYTLNIATPFNIEGPDGPADAASKLEFFLNFHLVQD